MDRHSTIRQLSRRNFLKTVGGGLAGAAVLGATGCGGGQNANGEVTISWWDYFGEGETNDAMQAQLDGYMEAHPNVTINRRILPYAELSTAMVRGAAADELPDVAVIAYTDHQRFAELGILEDLTQQVDSWGQADVYFENPWATTLWQDKNYGLPNSSNCLTLWYNKAFLESAEVEPPTTWEELKTTAVTLSEGDRFGLAVSATNTEEGVFQWLPFLWQSGADIPQIDSEGGRAALQLWVDMVREGSMSRGILGWTQQDVRNQFVAGQAAMMVNGPWQIANIRAEAPDLDWGVVPMPKGEVSANILGGDNYCIISGSNNVDTAWDVATWTQQPDNLRPFLEKTDRLPSRQDVAEDPEFTEDPVKSVFVEQFDIARPRSYGPQYPEISAVIAEAMQAAISGSSNVDAALARAQERITPLLPEQMQ